MMLGKLWNEVEKCKQNEAKNLHTTQGAKGIGPSPAY